MKLKNFLILLLVCGCFSGAGHARAPLLKGAVLSPQAVKAAQAVFKQQELLRGVTRGLVQISRPGAAEVLGTGFVFRAHKRYWVAMPYHIGGVAGSKRLIRFMDENGRVQEREVTIAVNGNSGYHAPDVSLAQFPEGDLAAVKPLRLGAPRLNEPAYSFGYVAGRVSAQDEILPMERRIFSNEGLGLISSRTIAGEDPEHPFNVSGYCGSPVMQWMHGDWRVVGLHTGSCRMPSSGNTRGFAVNLSRILPLLFARHLGTKPIYPRRLMFRGWILGELLPSEKVQVVEVWRAGECVLSRTLRNYPNPYSDEHSELVLEDFILLPQDVIRYEIRRNQREIRYVSYVLP